MTEEEIIKTLEQLASDGFKQLKFLEEHLKNAGELSMSEVLFAARINIHAYMMALKLSIISDKDRK